MIFEIFNSYLFLQINSYYKEDYILDFFMSMYLNISSRVKVLITLLGFWFWLTVHYP